MHQEIPNDSILLPEGVVEDDMKIVWMNRAFKELIEGELLEKEKHSTTEEEKNHANTQ